MRTGQVFVSHTSDMAQFPQDRSFTQAALDAVARAGLTAVDMRYFAARDDEPAAYCRARVQECAIFIAVIGFRYGSMVPGETVSFTELEFQSASAAGVPRLVFLLDEAAGVPDERADSDRGAVDSFRQRLQDAGLVVRTFNSSAGLELEVFHALSELTAGVRDDVITYLKALVGRVNTDPWPRDRRFGGPVLTPAAIERRLRVNAPGRLGEEDLDADDVAQQCRRLVVLGGPGSGKTWLARRTARRCAQSALRALAAGVGLDNVELPLYTTCSRLFSASGDIREAAVTSTLEQLGDLGGARLIGALGAFFAERNAPTVLVIDSLDESHGSQERLRQADTLPWRIVLTTRPSSWNQQLAITDDDFSRVGDLQPLRYPEDVEPFVHRWFAQEPGLGTDLVAQIARRPGLQQAATVPLILAFYCIVGGHEPLPDFRRDLFARVINRMLTGRWRDDDDRRPDVATCLQTLRRWAWPGPSECHPVSGVGIWTDDILTDQVPLSQADQDALDHIVMPLAPADVDTGQTMRRFIHRSIREHLVAEFAAALPRDHAVQVLLPHLWYDPDWEYSAPAAIAMHPENELLLRDLICRAAQSGKIPADLSVIGAGSEIRWLLAHLVAESSESDWSPGTVELAGRARAELAGSGRTDALSGAAQWAVSNRSVRQTLLGLLAGPVPARAAENLVSGVVQLSVTAEDQRQTREALLGLLPGVSNGYDASRFTAAVVSGLMQLSPSPQDKHHTRAALLRLLTRQSDGWIADKLAAGIMALEPAMADKQRARQALLSLVPRQSETCDAVWLVGRIARVAITAEDRRQTRAALLRLLSGQAEGWLADELRMNIVRLGHAVDPARPVGTAARAADGVRPALGPLLDSLAAAADSRAAAGLAAQVIRAGPVANERRQARAVLLGHLGRETSARTAAELAGTVLLLGPTRQDNRRIRDLLLRLLPGEQHSGTAARLSDSIIAAGPTAAEKRQARDALLRLLAGQQHGSQAARLTIRISKLGPTRDDRHQARDILLRVLGSSSDSAAAGQLAGWISRLGPTAAESRQTRDALLNLLVSQTDPLAAKELAGRLAQLGPTAQDRRLSADALLRLLADCTDSVLASGLLSTVAQLATSPADRRYLCDMLLGLLADTGSPPAEPLLAGLLDLTVTANDKRHVGGVLLKLLSAGRASAYETAELVTVVTRLAATTEGRRDALGALVSQLDECTDGWVASELAAGVIELGPSAQDKLRTRQCLLALLDGQTAAAPAARLVDRLAQLDPTVSDVTTWPSWASPPTRDLLAAVRRNSALTAWLSEVPSLATLSALS